MLTSKNAATKTIRLSVKQGGKPPAPVSTKSFASAAADGDLAAIRRMARSEPGLLPAAEPIHAAALHGHAAVVEFLIDHGGDANICSGGAHRYRPLHRVIERHKSVEKTSAHLDVVRVLLEGGADAMARGSWCGVTAIGLAAMGPEKQFLSLLLPYLSRWDIFHAAVLGDAGKVATILTRDPAAASAVDINGLSALHYAAASRLDRHDPATGAKLHRVAELLLAAGARIDTKARIGRHAPMTPAYFAAGNKSVLQALLLKGADAADALHPTLWAADYEVAATLVRAGANLKSARAAEWVSDFARWGQYSQAKWLVDHHADPNGRTKDGRTALHWAAQRGASVDFVRALLDAGANANLHDAEGATALGLAKVKNRARLITLLERHGACER